MTINREEIQASAAAACDDMTDEELWNSPLGHRLRTYADKLLAAEAERIAATAKRQTDHVVGAGIGFGRAIISPLGDPTDTFDNGDPDKVFRTDIDPWANWQSPEMKGLTEAVKATDGTRNAAQEAAKSYIASLQGELRPTAEALTDDEEKEATPLDVAGALSYLLTGHGASDRGPFVVHEGDGFHPEPYVMLPLDSMRKVLDEIPGSRW